MSNSDLETKSRRKNSISKISHLVSTSANKEYINQQNQLKVQPAKHKRLTSNSVQSEKSVSSGKIF